MKKKIMKKLKTKQKIKKLLQIQELSVSYLEAIKVLHIQNSLTEDGIQAIIDQVKENLNEVKDK
jgi:hypothetical protein